MAEKATVDEIKEVIKELDFDFWYAREKLGRAKELITRKIGKKVVMRDMRAALDVCEWWRQKPRPGAAPATRLSSSRWELLREAVELCLPDLHGRTLDECVAIVSLRFRCNRRLLLGLCSDLHVWVGGPKKEEKLPHWLSVSK